MSPELIPDDEDYDSKEDSDFAPDAAPAKEDAESSDDEPEPGIIKAKSTKRKRRSDEETEDVEFENSGDEAIIKKGLKRQKKNKKGKEDVEGLDDQGGEGGLVKTRSMRAAAKTEKKVALVDLSKATVDVDALWQKMISGKSLTSLAKPTSESPSKSRSPEIKHTTIPEIHSHAPRSPSAASEGVDSIMIKRTYTFAGKVHTERKLVPRNSAEAKLFLVSEPNPSTSPPIEDASADPFTKPKRPTKRARRSIFEPVVELPQRRDLIFGHRKPQEVVDLLGTGDKGKKLNTVEKSAMDWAGFVDKEGIADELDAAGKKKGGFKERQEFMARTEMRKEEDARRARGVGLV